MNWRHTLQLCTALLLIAIACIVMAGWVLKIRVWSYLGPNAVMTFNTALASGLGGVALCALWQGSPRGVRIARGLGAVIAAFAALLLTETVAGLDLHLDWRALHSWVQAEWPGRMAPVTAFALMTAGAVLALQSNAAISTRLRYALLSLLLTIVCLNVVVQVTLIDPMLFQSVALAPWLQLPIMTPTTVIAMALLGAGLLLHESHVSARHRGVEPSDRGVFGFLGAAFAVLVGVATVSFSSIKELEARSSWIDHNIQVRVAIEEFTDQYDMVRGTWWRALVWGNSDDFMRMESEIEVLNQRLDKLMRLTTTDAKQQKHLSRLRNALQPYLQAMRTDVARRSGSGYMSEAEIGKIIREPPLGLQDVLLPLQQIRFQESALLRERQQVSTASMRRATQILLAGNGVAFAIMMAAFWALLYSQQQRSRLEQGLRVVNENLETRIAQRTGDLRDANAELESLNATLEQRVAERTADLEDFSYSVSHDLRAPLRAIDGYSLILREDHADRLDEDGRRLIRQIHGHVQRMGTLIDDLLRLSRLGRRSLTPSRLDMNAVAAEVAEEVLRDELTTGGRAPRLQLLSLPPALADASLLRQVWINLLSNAVKYSGRVEHPLIVVDGRIADAEAVYSVRDNGAGFDMAHAGKLFGVFQRLHRYEEFPGTGVGLAIVQRIVRRHGGRVWAESAVNQGATFYFSLPRAGDGHERH